MVVVSAEPSSIGLTVCVTMPTFVIAACVRRQLEVGKTIPLDFQIGMEARLPQISQLAHLREEGTTEEDDAESAAAIKTSNHQHPDHETSDWPIEG